MRAVAVAMAWTQCLATARAAPEVLRNGFGEQPPATGWAVAGNASSVQSVQTAGGASLLPAQGARFFVLGPGTFVTMTQSGTFPYQSERLVLRGKLRAPGAGAIVLRLRAYDHDGHIQIERTSNAPAGGDGWTPVQLTYAIPSLAERWEVAVLGIFPGVDGLHADDLLLVPTCVPDFTGDRVLNFFDIVAFIERFTVQDPDADLTGNGVIDFFDIAEMVDSFEFPCE